MGIADDRAEDVTTMLNQLHTVSDIAADRRRALLDDAETYRLARVAAAGAKQRPRAEGTRVARFVRSLTRAAADSPAEAC